MTNFEKSEIYKKALKEYQEKVYGLILKPLHIIVIDNDLVYLFYNQGVVEDILNQMKTIYNDEDINFPESLGYEEPRLETIKFMGNEYKIIVLWYDKCDLPSCFEAKI